MFYVCENDSPQKIYEYGYENEVYFDKIKVKNTETGEIKEYKNKELLVFIQENKNKFHVFGTKVWGINANKKWVFTTVLKPNFSPDNNILYRLLQQYKEARNAWNLAPIMDYVAMLPKGTKITLNYKTTYDSERNRVKHSRTATYKKTSFSKDNWYIEDGDAIYSEATDSSDFVADCLGINTCLEFRLNMEVEKPTTPIIKKCITFKDSNNQIDIPQDNIYQINGTYHIRRNQKYGYTARFSRVCILTKDGRSYDLKDFGKDKSKFGAGFDVVADMFAQFMCRSTLPKISVLDSKAYNEFGTHKFTITLDNNFNVVVQTRYEGNNLS